MKKVLKTLSGALFVFSALTILALFAKPLESAPHEDEPEVLGSLCSDSEERVVLVDENGKSAYTIVFSSDATSVDADLSMKIQTLLASEGAIVDSFVDVTLRKPLDHEILIGNTDREESAFVLSELEKICSRSDDLAWGYAVIGKKVIFTANSDTAFKYGQDSFLEYLADSKYSLPCDLLVLNTKTLEDYEAELEEQRLKKRVQTYAKLLEMNAEFKDSQFNTDRYTPGVFYKPMTGAGGYYENGWTKGRPWAYPTDDVHPRYLITEKNTKRIAEILLSDESSDYFELAETFRKFVNTDIEDIDFGVFPVEYTSLGAGPFRYNAETLAIIEAKALAYLLTGDDYYAYEAIVGIKNAMLSLHYTTALHVDVYHGASHVMITLAAVYDWCYDALSETDKWQLIWGAAQILGPQMESGMRYPPTGMNGFNGHGTGPQLLRDWMTLASVFYDEAPDWWELVAGRYFNEYLEFANAQFTNGWISQGSANYAPLKVHVQAWAAYIIYTATGENFLTDDARLTMYYQMSHVTPKNGGIGLRQLYFQTGDATRNEIGSYVGFAEYLVVAALYNDPVIYAQAKSTSENHTAISYDTILTMTPALHLCFASAVDYNGESARDGVETIQYFGDPAGQMTAREAWGDPNSAAVMMRLLNYSMQNHEGLDHGTFQIYYKGLLAASTGAYNYGSVSHVYYLQSTVAHNGLLVFNPSLASTEPEALAGYYYSGGQRHKAMTVTSAEAWLNSGRMVTTIGADYGYGDDGASKYAYLAGDLSPSYDEKTVEYIARHMLTLFTGDEDLPALFITFDQITAREESFRKSWLLHTVKEPEIDVDELGATVINGDGKMYVKSLFGADAIVKIGGEGKAWWINGYFEDPNDRGSWDVKTQSFTDPANIGSWVEGKNAVGGAPNDYADRFWGRIELRAEGENSTSLLTLMAVADANCQTELEYTKLSSDTVYGLEYKNSIVAFANANAKIYKEFSFETPGKGLYEYYVANVEAGTWQVIVDGVTVAHSLSEEEGGLLTFTAPAGNVTLKPGNDVIGANGGRIQYNSGGGVLPKDAPFTYNNETATPLPEDLKRGDDTFIGWYTSPNYEPETKITEIPVGTSGIVKLYVKWVKCFLNEDYSDTVLNLFESAETVGDVTYNASGKTGASFITKYDEARECNYLEWIEGERDPIISHLSSNNLSTIEDPDKCVSFSFRLSLEAGAPAMRTNARLIAKHDVNGATIGAANVYLFQTDAKGNVVTNGGSTLAVLSDAEVTDIRIVVDFKDGEMRYYDRDYNLVVTDKWTPPESTGAENAEEYLTCLREYLWYFYGDSSAASSAATLRIYGITVREGDAYSDKAHIQTEGIKYNTGGALLPDDAPTDFAAGTEATELPALSMKGYVFDGWYTTPTFDAGTKTTHAPAGSSGLYEVWAKWLTVFIDEDYSDTDIDLGEGESTETNGLLYGGYSNPGVFFKTEGEDGNKYLVWTTGTKDPQFNAQNTSSNVSTMNESSVSYTLTVSKNGEESIPGFELRLIGKHTVDGKTGVITSDIRFAKISGGTFCLGDGAVEIGAIGDEALTVRIVLDFAYGMLEAYNESGEVIASTPMPEVPAATGASSHKEWMKCFRSYIFYMRKNSGEGSIRIHELKIQEGNAFGQSSDDSQADSSIKYMTCGGVLAENSPRKYDPTVDTELPIPKKSGHIFGGWYTDPDFGVGTKTTFVPAGTEGAYEIWAKWIPVLLDEDYRETVIDLGEGESTTANGILYDGGGYAKAYFKTEGEGENRYLLWTTGTKTPTVSAENADMNISTIDGTSLSYTLTLGKNGAETLPNFEFSLIGKHTVGGKADVVTSSIVFAKISGGSFYLGNGEEQIATVGEEPITVRIVLDFALGVIDAYGADGSVIASVAMPEIPEATGAVSYAEWMKCFRSNLLHIRKISRSGAIRIYGIVITAGNVFVA